jgi:hypothetical protein
VSVRRVNEQSVLPACPEGMQMSTAGNQFAELDMASRDQSSGA